MNGLDAEVVTNVNLLARGGWLPHEVTHIERVIADRQAFVEAGLHTPTGQYWTAKLQSEIEANLRVRWDFNNGWVIDRWIREDGWWLTIGVLGFHCIRPDLVDYLRSRDMQRVSPDEYLQQKRAAAERVRQSNEKDSTNKVLAAVDSLSDKRVKEFIEVERAMQTGETIVARGETEAMLGRMHRASEQAEQSPEAYTPSENEAYNPFKLTRESGGEHI